MRNKISFLTLAMLGVATISSVSVEARKPKTSRFKGKQSQVIQNATNPATSAGLVQPVVYNNTVARAISASDCLAGTYFNGTGCEVCAAGTYSVAGASACTLCGDNVATCDGKTGTIISCATGYKLDSGACVVDPNASTDPDKEKFVKLKEKYALQLAEVSASCSGISNELDTIFGLNNATIASSAVGTAASGAALATNLIKVNRQNKALKAAKSTADVEKLTDKDFEEAFKTWSDNVDTEDKKLNDVEDLYGTSKILVEVADNLKTLATEAGVSLPENFDNDISPDIRAYVEKQTEVNVINAKDELSKDDQNKLDSLTEEINAFVDLETKVATAGTAIDNLVSNMKNVDLSAYAKAQKEAKLAEISGGKSANGLGTATTLSMAGSALASAASTAMSGVNIAKIDKVLKSIEECNARLDDLRIIKGEMSTLQVDDVNKTVEQADKIDAACKFKESDVKAVKGLTIASTVTSGVGTVTGTVGAVTSGLSNSKNEEKFTADKKKKLNTATSILAGVSAGTGASTVVTSGVASAKIKPVLEQAKKCTSALQENLVTVKYSRAISDISFDGE